MLSRVPAGVFKVNFAGGEPLLNQHLGEYLRHARQLGLKTSIITNGSLIRRTWLHAYGPFIDQVGISIDSLDDDVNKEIGRGYGKHVHTTRRAIGWVQSLNQELGLDIKLKLNTVVLKNNHTEDWNSFLQDLAPLRWKVFKVLSIEGENDHSYDDLAITDQQFQAFVERHESLANHGVVMAPENNEEMTLSYVMMTPDGKLYQNGSGKYVYSDPVLDVGFGSALTQVGFDYGTFEKRGGAYAL